MQGCISIGLFSVDKIAKICKDRDVKMLIIYKKDIALAFSVMYFQRIILDEKDTSMDRKIGNTELLMISK